jgi:hypothetical protein
VDAALTEETSRRLAELTLDERQSGRPDLLAAIRAGQDADLAALRRRVEELEALNDAGRRPSGKFPLARDQSLVEDRPVLLDAAAFVRAISS